MRKIILGCFMSLLKASIIPLVYEVATLLSWFVGIGDTADRELGIVDTHRFSWGLDIVNLIIPCTCVLFTYNLYKYLKQFNKQCDKFDA